MPLILSAIFAFKLDYLPLSFLHLSEYGQPLQSEQHFFFFLNIEYTNSPTRKTAIIPTTISAIGIPDIIYIIPKLFISVPNWKTSAEANHATNI